MPIYEYRCNQCAHQDSDIESFKAPRVKKCPQCGKRSFVRLVSAAAFHLKGGGWYETDFKNKPKEQEAKSQKSEKPDKTEKTGKTNTADKTDKTTSEKTTQGGDKTAGKKSVPEKPQVKN